MTEHKKLIAIVPANNWYASIRKYYNQDTDIDRHKQMVESRVILEALVAWGLYSNGDVAPLVWDDNKKEVVDANILEGFVWVRYQK